MIKRGLQEVAVLTTNRKDMEAEIDIARTVLPPSQDTLIVPVVTPIIQARRIR